MLTDLWEYIRALFRHWKGFVMGSAVGCRNSGSDMEGIEFPDRSWGIVFLGGVVVAGFLAWREQYRRHPDPEISRHIGQLSHFKETATHNILATWRNRRGGGSCPILFLEGAPDLGPTPLH